jgi:hypothetical protein
MRLNRGQIGLLFDYVVDRYISLTYIVWLWVQYAYSGTKLFIEWHIKHLKFKSILLRTYRVFSCFLPCKRGTYSGP